LLFQKSPEKTLQAVRANRDRLTAKLAESEQGVIERKAAAQALARDGADDATLTAAEDKLRAAQDRMQSIASARIEVEQQLAELDREQAQLADIKTRAETATEIELMAAKLERLTPQFDAHFEQILEIANHAAASGIWDGAALANYANASRIQISAAFEMTAKSLRERRDRVLDGRSPSTLTKPDAPRAAVAVAEPPVVRVFTTKNISWTTAEGQKTAGKFNDVDLPPETAQRALASGICQPIGGELWRQWSGTKALVSPPVAECTALDAVDVGGTAEVIPLNADMPTDPRFQRVDRGPPVILRVPREA